MYSNPFLSIVVPVYNGDYPFIYCLLAIKKSTFKDWELIVVDDESTDQSALIAAEFGATVLKTGGRLGPGAARNLGAKAAKGEYLCFVDADCEIHTNTLENLADTLKQHPNVDALFGSYDDTPKAPNFVAQYKNLFHHYIHQNGNQDASTFWAGCGAVRRSLFLQLGGFDTQRYPRPSIEDIDLGYRIKQAGGRICLAKHVQVKHHKAWNLINLIKTDVFDRGIPWTKLLLSNKSHQVNDLNLKLNSRVSVLATYGLLVSLLLSFYQPKIIILSSILAGLILAVNFDVYRFFYQKRGKRFALKVVLMHWLYYLYGGLAFAFGTLFYWREQLIQSRASTSEI
jgi:glycosyltransferase involved in cell wall biosynthesis